MLIDLDLAGRRVVVVGTARGARRTVERFLRSDALVTLACVDQVPMLRRDGVRHILAPGAGDTSGWLRLLGPARLLVLVDAAPLLERRVLELASHLRLTSTTEPPADAGACAVFIGSGSMSVGPLVVETIGALAVADVVVVDAWTGHDAIEALAPVAELVDLNQVAGHRERWQSLAELVVTRARAGSSVVRLGGDGSFPSGTDDKAIRACREAGVRVRTIAAGSTANAIDFSVAV